jgi:DNA modification methylase
VGAAPSLNNIEVGKHGRWRSTIWTYPGAFSLGSDARRGLPDHPTVKPTVMLEDALLDLRDRGDVVIDPSPPLKLIFEVSDAASSNRLSAGVRATDG